MHKVSPLSVAVLCLTLCCACARGTTDDEPYPLSGTRWQGSYVLEEMEDGLVYCDSTFYAMTMDTATGLIHMTDRYYVNGTLSSNDTASLAFSYHFAGHSGMLTFVYQGDTSSCPFSVNGNMLTLSFLTFYKVP